MGDTLRVVGAPTKHEFLSPDWIAAVEAIRDEFAGRAAELGAPPVVVRANVVVTDAPFAPAADVHGHIDTSLGLAIAPGHLDRPDFTASLDYDTAKALFVAQDPAAVMQAFFGGKIRLTGDASKLLAMPMPKPGQTGPEVDLFREVAGRVQAVTA
jgi:hypothetical protein